uniref:Galectin n=1 Tax=Culicoides sonorensis TaxID=179676 RepID=A0A336KHY2_CULSO
MATIPIHNPQLPFLGLIPGGLRPGVMLRFRGIVHHEGRDDVALHLSIRPKENVLVRNHYQNRVWGPEERYGGCPIYFGQTYDILVLAEHSQYKIAVNGSHLCTFTHRIPLSRVTFVSVSGQGVIHVIGLENDNNMGGSITSTPSAPPSNLPIYPPPPGAQVCPIPNVPPYPPGPVYPPHGGIPVYPNLPGGMNPPPPYTPSPYPGGNMSSSTTSYPAASTDPHPTSNQINQQTHSKGIIGEAKSLFNGIIGNKSHTTNSYPTNNIQQQNSNPYHQGYGPSYPMQSIPSQQQYYPSVPSSYPQGVPGQHSSNNHGILGALGGGTAAALLTGAVLGKKGKKGKKKALKYAAGAGALGLGAYSIHKLTHKKKHSSSSSSSSD